MQFTSPGRFFASVAAAAMLGGLADAQTEDAAKVARGKSVYEEQRCSSCHSIGGVGNKRNPLDGVGGKLSEEDVRKWIVSPREMDPKVRKRPYDKLSADDLDALVAYMTSLKDETGGVESPLEPSQP